MIRLPFYSTVDATSATAAACTFFFAFSLSFSVSATEARHPQFLYPSSAAASTNSSSPTKKAGPKIVSLAPVVTETLFSLGLGEQVVGVTRFCDRPIEAKSKPKIGGYVDVSLERVLALSPDLVIAMPSLGQRELLKQVASQGISVYIVFGDTLVEIEELIIGIGSVTHRTKEANVLLRGLQKGLLKARSASALSKRSVLLLVAAAPLVAAGPTTFANDALLVLGLENAARKGPQWPVLSLESLVALKPDLIVVVSGPSDGKNVREKISEAGLNIEVRVPKEPILMRPGPSLHLDVQILGKLLASPVKDAP